MVTFVLHHSVRNKEKYVCYVQGTSENGVHYLSYLSNVDYSVS